MVYSHAGAEVVHHRKPYIQASREDRDCVLFGPYIKLPAGDFCVQFELLLVSAWKLDPRDVICRLDVATAEGHEIFAQLDVRAEQLPPRAPTKIRLRFQLQRPTEKMEFRVWPGGVADFAVALDRPVEGAISTAPQLAVAS